MALGACRECGEKVSMAAKTCPRCGVRSPDPRRVPDATTSGGLYASLLIVVVLLGSFILVNFVLD